MLKMLKEQYFGMYSKELVVVRLSRLFCQEFLAKKSLYSFYVNFDSQRKQNWHTLF